MSATNRHEERWPPTESEPVDPTYILAAFVYGAIPLALYSDFITAHDAFYFGTTRFDQLVIFSTLTVLGAWLSGRQLVRGGAIRRILFLLPLLAHLCLIGYKLAAVYQDKAG